MTIRSALPRSSYRPASGAIAHSIRVASLLVLVACTGCGALARRTTHAPCTPRFDTHAGWRGGDGVFAVALPDRFAGERRTVWLFGDSFVTDPANPPRPDRAGAAFIHNSIALSSCRDDVFELDFVWRKKKTGRPYAFFERPDANRSWYWPFDGFVHGGALYVGLLEVAAAPPVGTLGMPFELTGMVLARIDDPGAPPATWRPRIMKLSRSREAFPGAAMRIEGSHVLLFSFASIHDGHQPRFLARLPLEALDREVDDLEPWLETWTRDGEWRPGLLPDQAEILMADNATEMSVEAHGDDSVAPDLLAIYGSPVQTDGHGQAPAERSNVIYARRAAIATGPWSERLPVYRMPESSDPAGGTICYAAKEHPAFARPGELLITYVCNTTWLPGEGDLEPLSRLESDMDIYVPRVIRIPVPDWPD